MSDESNYDELLFPILHNEGQIAGFLDAVFSFLGRRTDFFQIRMPDNPSFGLPVGVAEQLVKKSFCNNFQKVHEEINKIEDALCEDVPLSDITVEVSSTSLEDSAEEDLIDEVVIEEVPEDDQACAAGGDILTAEKCEEKRLQYDPDCYNGNNCGNYSWAQTLKDIDVQIRVPAEISSGKCVKVCVKQSTLNVEVLEGEEWKPLVGGELTWEINVDACFWTLIPYKHIHVSLEKAKERWWDSLFVSESKIDVKSIDATQSYDDLDDESQAKIRELVYNQQQKQLGKPTSEEMKIADILKDAWDLEGSPFKGQPYSPEEAIRASSSVNPGPK